MNNPESLEGIPQACLRWCPHVKHLLEISENMSEMQDDVANFAMSEGLDEVAARVCKVVGDASGAEVAADELATTLRQASGAQIERIAEVMDRSRAFARRAAEGCEGPIEVTGVDSKGRFVGAFVCASTQAPDGEVTESVTVFRFPRH